MLDLWIALVIWSLKDNDENDNSDKDNGGTGDDDGDIYVYMMMKCLSVSIYSVFVNSSLLRSALAPRKSQKMVTFD